MKNLFLFIILFSFQNNYFSQSESATSKINSVGVGTISAFPNAAEITLAMDHIKPTLRDAINENQKTTADVLRIVKKYIDDTLQIKTSLISTNKATKWDNKLGREVFIGFESSQKIVFTLKDLAKMQDFTEELLKTKFNKIERVAYFNTEAQEFIKKAQELAIIDAIESTKRIANISEVQLGKILYIYSNNSPNDNSKNRVESYEFESYGKSMGGRGVSSSGDLIKYSVSVTMHTEIL
jgi:uncharacterized protein YggE